MTDEKARFEMTGESLLADDEKSNEAGSLDDSRSFTKLQEKGMSPEERRFSGEIMMNGESPTLSRISEEDSPLGHTNKLSTLRNESGVFGGSEGRLSDAGYFHIEVKKMQMSVGV